MSRGNRVPPRARRGKRRWSTRPSPTRSTGRLSWANSGTPKTTGFVASPAVTAASSPPGRRGICKVRFNQGGQLRVPFGYVAGGWPCDPVEKKPFFHVYPGSDALTFGMLGCDFHCSYCQNWVTSQALRDERAAAPISNRHAGATGEHGSPRTARGWSCRATTNRSSPPNGPWPSSSRRTGPGWPAPSSPTATPRPKRWISCARGLSPTRLT